MSSILSSFSTVSGAALRADCISSIVFPSFPDKLALAGFTDRAVAKLFLTTLPADPFKLPAIF